MITFEDVLQFFVNEWATIVNSLHSATTGNTVEEFLWVVLEVIKELPTNEVRKVSRKYTLIRGGSRGGSLGSRDPPLQTVLILKQALQIIILIGAKTIII